MAASNSAPTAPSMTRWSADSVHAITWPTRTSRPTTTGREMTAPTPRIQLCGGFTMAYRLSTPYIPRFEIVKVPPAYSSGRNWPSRARATSPRVSVAMAARSFPSAARKPTIDVLLCDAAVRSGADDLLQREPGHGDHSSCEWRGGRGRSSWHSGVVRVEPIEHFRGPFNRNTRSRHRRDARVGRLWG